MAKAPAKQEEAPAEKSIKKKPKLLLFIIIGAVLVLAAGGTAAYFLLKAKKAALESEEGGHAEAKKEAKFVPPVFVRFDSFTVKLQPENDKQDQYLQVVPELRALDIKVSDRIKQFTPEIRYKILLLLSNKRASELSSPQGMEKLSNEIRIEVNRIVEGTPKKIGTDPSKAGPEDLIQAVVFTSFIIQ